LLLKKALHLALLAVSQLLPPLREVEEAVVEGRNS
jgi:hypothetical protein